MKYKIKSSQKHLKNDMFKIKKNINYKINKIYFTQVNTLLNVLIKKN